LIRYGEGIKWAQHGQSINDDVFLFSPLEKSPTRLHIPDAWIMHSADVAATRNRIIVRTSAGDVYSWKRKRLNSRPDTLPVFRQNSNCFSTDKSGNLIAIGDDTGSVFIFDLRSNKTICKIKTDSSSYVESIAFHPTKKILVIGRKDGQLSVWDFSTAQPTELLHLVPGVTSAPKYDIGLSIDSLAFDAEGKHLFVHIYLEKLLIYSFSDTGN
jgi:WD40 repeat protein